MKRMNAVFMLLVVCMFITNNLVSVQAKELKEKGNQMKKSFSEQSKGKKYTTKKIKEEKKNSTNLLGEDVENYLNQEGMFDDEIKSLDDVTLDEISNCDLEYLGVQTSYFELINENIETTVNEENNNQSNYIELTPEEIEEVIAEQYYDVDLSDETEDISVVDKVLETIGLKATEVYASNNYDEKGPANGSYLKRTILIVPTLLNGVQYYKLLATYEWLTMPINRLVDVPVLSWDENVRFNNTSYAFNNTKVKVIETYTDEVREQLVGTLISSQEEYSEYELKGKYYTETAIQAGQTIETGNFVITNRRLFAFVDLMDDTSYADDYERRVYKRYVDYIKIIMSTYVKRDSADEENMTLNVFYYHTKSNQKIEIKSVGFKFSNKYLDTAAFLLYNVNSVKYTTTQVMENEVYSFTYNYK